MNLNWMVMVIVFMVTLVISILIGAHLPKSVGFIVPIIGGLIAGYSVGGNYTDGIVNGGIPVCLAGFMYTLDIIVIKGNKITASFNTLIYSESHLKLLISFLYVGLVLYFFFGIIGGLLGFAIKERKIIKRILVD